MSDDKIKEIRETIESNNRMLNEFEGYLIENLPNSQFTLDSLEYLQRYNQEVGNIWIRLYELHYRDLDIIKSIHNIEENNRHIKERLDTLENDG